MTAGTIFDRTRTPLTVWFHACWLFATAKDGISTQRLQRVLEIDSYQTAWTMLHRLRLALVRPGRGLLAGTVEVDETFTGGEEHGLRGGRQPGKKVLAGIAVEVSEPKSIGRCRMAVLADASAASLRPFVTGSVEPGSRVITDGWVGYNGLAVRGYDHERRNQEAAARRGEDPGDLLPAVHRVASLCKRWLLGTHQGSAEPAHPAGLPERVHLPVQPPPLTQPRHGVLPRHGTGRQARPGPLPRHPRRQETAQPATTTAARHRPPAQPGPPRRGTALAHR